MVHGNEKMSLPCDFGDCPRSLHFTLLTYVWKFLSQQTKNVKTNIKNF